MKIKVFKFTVSNSATYAFSDDMRTEWYKKCIAEIDTPEKIEETVNNFIDSVGRVISITINNVDEHYHNNGCGNTIILVYTILYEE